MPGQETEGKIAIHDYEKFVGLNLSEYFKNKYHLPVIFVNDVNAAVAGYLGCEEKREINSAVYVYFPQKYPAGALCFPQYIQGRKHTLHATGSIQKRIFRRKPPRGGNIKSGKGSNLPYPLIYLPDSNMQI